MRTQSPKRRSRRSRQDREAADPFTQTWDEIERSASDVQLPRADIRALSAYLAIAQTGTYEGARRLRDALALCPNLFAEAEMHLQNTQEFGAQWIPYAREAAATLLAKYMGAAEGDQHARRWLEATVPSQQGAPVRIPKSHILNVKSQVATYCEEVRTLWKACRRDPAKLLAFDPALGRIHSGRRATLLDEILRANDPPVTMLTVRLLQPLAPHAKLIDLVRKATRRRGAAPWVFQGMRFHVTPG